MKMFLKILLIITWIGLAAGAAVLMGFANQSHNQQRCTGITVNVDCNGNEQLVTPEIIKSQLKKEFGKFENKLIGDISIEAINRFLGKNQYIDHSDVHLTVEGQLVADLSQCVPVLRIVTLTGQSFYIDNKGKVMRADPDFPVRVVVATGAIATGTNPIGKNISSWTEGKKNIAPEILNLSKAFQVAAAISNDSIMKALAEQIYVSPEGEIKLLTKAGSHIVLIGDASNLEEKFEKLEAFYRSGLPKIGWNRYKTINLAYKNQVICTK